MGCTGACCVVFPVGSSRDWMGSTRVQDGDMLAFMLRPLTTEQAEARRKEFGVERKVQPDTQFYKCVYWDEETRLCGAYEDRPEMCSEYPYPLTALNTDGWGRSNNEHPSGAGVCDHGCDCKGAPLLWDGED